MSPTTTAPGSVANLSERTVWIDEREPFTVQVIDQRRLPFSLANATIRTSHEMADAIRDMTVRGAGCIGVAAAYGMYLAAVEASGDGTDAAREILNGAARELVATRPTAVNLEWAVDQLLVALLAVSDGDERVLVARDLAARIADDDIANCRSIGDHGLALIRTIHQRTERAVNVLTHCNAGWLAFVQQGSATAPIYAAHDAGVPVHVYVGETRPRSQGTLTAWEFRRRGVDHTYVVDNAVGHLLQRGDVDVVIVGADRVTMRGDAANKIGTYLRALAAHANGVPFYVALPSSTLDPVSFDGFTDIPIEQRPADEVTHVVCGNDGDSTACRVLPEGTPVQNPAFDVTPAGLITGLITERGVCPADEDSIAAMFPELAGAQR